MKSSIALIGFMGVGKTDVGQALAEKLNKKFVEMDALIEQKAGKSIPEIFQQGGEIAFRELEIEITKEVSQGKNQVIACGGGVVLNKINIDRLKKGAVLVYLTASPEVILKRISSGGEERPLLKTDDKAAVVQEMLSFRKPFYERAADITIDTSQLDINAVAEQIITKTEENEGINR
jgi:shikimate kinase